MIRVLLYLLIGFIVWKIVQLVSRSLSRGGRTRPGVDDLPGASRQPGAQGFRNIQDAEFEELPPDTNKDDKPSQ